MILNFADIARYAGFAPVSPGKFDLQAGQYTADQLANAALSLIHRKEPGSDNESGVVLTGPGPTWACLAIACALQGRVRSLAYAATNAPEIVIFRKEEED